MKRTLIPLCALVLVGGAIAAQQQYSLTINGKPSNMRPLEIGGKLYIPIEALKNTSVTVLVKNNVVDLRLPKVSGGADQQAAVEGKQGDWLFNGIWRFRVTGIQKQEGDRTGYKVDVELRNGSTYNQIALSGTGWNGITLVLADGTVVNAVSDAIDLRDAALDQGVGATPSIFFETSSASKPSKIILRLDPAGLAGTQMKYAVKDPSFRVLLGDDQAR